MVVTGPAGEAKSTLGVADPEVLCQVTCTEARPRSRGWVDSVMGMRTWAAGEETSPSQTVTEDIEIFSSPAAPASSAAGMPPVAAATSSTDTSLRVFHAAPDLTAPLLGPLPSLPF
ncbi:MAG: hypothetical protein KatS3mg008_1050 [Acidimicrobiales bacterium]|nr:MAG: hypothetical protein KatS3mg008_1050 [Acidimicrobiales bacterium]